MIRAFASVTLSGDSFSPKALLEKIPTVKFRSSHEPGDERKYTKRTVTNEGEIIDYIVRDTFSYGGAIIDHASNLNKAGREIEWKDMLDFLVDHHQTMRECGVEYIDLTLNFFYQENSFAWHIEESDIKCLASLGIGLSIDWYHIEDESVYPDHVKEPKEYE